MSYIMNMCAYKAIAAKAITMMTMVVTIAMADDDDDNGGYIVWPNCR